jgi:hypothetical protein
VHCRLDVVVCLGRRRGVDDGGLDGLSLHGQGVTKHLVRCLAEHRRHGRHGESGIYVRHDDACSAGGSVGLSRSTSTHGYDALVGGLNNKFPAISSSLWNWGTPKAHRTSRRSRDLACGGGSSPVPELSVRPGHDQFWAVGRQQRLPHIECKTRAPAFGFRRGDTLRFVARGSWHF